MPNVVNDKTSKAEARGQLPTQLVRKSSEIIMHLFCMFSVFAGFISPRR